MSVLIHHSKNTSAHQPPFWRWGKNDCSFCRTAPRLSGGTILAVVRFDTGHFAPETHAHEIAGKVCAILK
jgi:hypothetical protein